MHASFIAVFAPFQVSGERDGKPLDNDRLVAFIYLLNDLFWKIFVKRPSNPAIAPVVNPG